MKVKYPIIADTPAAKLAYLQRLYEVLRLHHNTIGSDYKKGNITEKQWDDFQRTEFDPKHAAIINEILEQRRILRNDLNIPVDLNADFE